LVFTIAKSEYRPQSSCYQWIKEKIIDFFLSSNLLNLRNNLYL
jgi:hypothetical protein